MVDARHSWLMSIAVITVYQLALSALGLSEYILDDADRHDAMHVGGGLGLFAANREGVCSCCGFLALYLAALQLGRCLMLTHRRVSPSSALGHLISSHLISSRLIADEIQYR